MIRQLLLSQPLIFLAFSLWAQPCYDISGWDIPAQISFDDNNNLMVTGFTDGGLLFLRTSLFGETLTQKAIPLEGQPFGNSIVEAGENNYLIGGEGYLYGEPGQNRPFLLKVDSAGNVLWRRDFLPVTEGEGKTIARHILRNTQQQAVYLATTDTVWMIGYDGATLAHISAQEMGLPGFHSLDMVFTDEGPCVLAAATASAYRLLRFDEELQFLGGSSLITSFYSYGQVQSFYAVSDGNFLIGGQAHTDYRWKIIKVDGQGSTLWERTYSFPNYSWGYPNEVEAYEDGFLIAGSLAKITPYGFCPVLVKIDANGSPKWLQQVSDCGTNNGLDGLAIHPSIDNLIVVAGRMECSSGNDIDAYITIVGPTPTIILADEEANEPASFIAFPNPAGGPVQALLPDNGPWELSLFDAGGQLALQTRVHGKSHTLDTSPLPPGIYLLRAANGRQLFSRRLVIGGQNH